MPEGIHEQLIFLFLQSLLEVGLFIDQSEQLVMRPDLLVPDEGSTDRAGDGLISVDFEHAFDTLVAEKMLMRTCQHGPSSHDVVGLEANVAKVSA